MDAELIQAFLQSRLDYHFAQGNSRQSFKVEISALAKLEVGLSLFSETHRIPPVRYDFTAVRLSFTGNARKLTKQTAACAGRAIPDPVAAIQALPEERHRLMARLQLECGCRAEGVGAPVRDVPGGNRLRQHNFMAPDGKSLPPFQLDPLTGNPVIPFWTREKGGKVAWKMCPEPLFRDVFSWLNGHPEGLGDEYRIYLAAINAALRVTRQEAGGRGTHCLRFCFARRRYKECLQAGMGDEEAKRFVSLEMSHNRPDITEVYLK